MQQSKQFFINHIGFNIKRGDTIIFIKDFKSAMTLHDLQSTNYTFTSENAGTGKGRIHVSDDICISCSG